MGKKVGKQARKSSQFLWKLWQFHKCLFHIFMAKSPRIVNQSTEVGRNCTSQWTLTIADIPLPFLSANFPAHFHQSFQPPPTNNSRRRTIDPISQHILKPPIYRQWPNPEVHRQTTIRQLLQRTNIRRYQTRVPERPKNRGHQSDISYSSQQANNRTKTRTKKRQIVWFNPSFNKSV